MTDMSPTTASNLRKKNLITGFVIGGIALSIMVIALVRFTIWGLPEDRETYEQQQQEQSAIAPESVEEEKP